MADEVVKKEVVTEEVTVANLVDRLEAVSKNMNTTQLAQVAANGGVEEKKVDIKGGDVEVEDKTAKEKRINSLQKNFETAAKADVNFRHFATTKAMDDPVSYLHDVVINIKGRPEYKVSEDDLENLIQISLAAGAGGKDTETKSLNEWADRYQQRGAVQSAFGAGLRSGVFGSKEENNTLSKALDSSSGQGGPLIRTDIDPLLREAYLRKFPLYDQIRKFPANGLVHTYNQRTSAGTASLVDEMGDLAATESQSTYVRQANSHIGVLATRRQISLKVQYAISQSGMNWDLGGTGGLEVTGALGEIARLDQTLICQGNYTTAGGTLDTEDGLYNNFGFDGLRTILKGASASVTKDANTTYLRTINKAIADIVNAGGNVDNIQILCSLYAKMDIEDELINFLRVTGIPGSGFPTNFATNGITTVADTLTRLMPIPAAAQNQGLGYYTLSSVATEDLYLTDPAGIGLAYLGSPTPSILELPVGFNNALSNVYIPFVMHGLTVFVTNFNRKIRIPRVIA